MGQDVQQENLGCYELNVVFAQFSEMKVCSFKKQSENVLVWGFNDSMEESDLIHVSASQINDAVFRIWLGACSFIYV